MRKLPAVAVTVLAIAVLFCIALPAAADAQGSVFGLKGGVSSSKLLFGDDEDAMGTEDFLKNRSGMAGGVYLAFGANRSLGFQVEALYVEKGVAGEAEFEGEDIEGEMFFTYVEVPVLVRFSLPMGSARPYLFGGAAAAMELSCEVSFTFGGQTESSDCHEQEEGEQSLRKIDIGGVVGAGVEFALGRMTLGVDGRLTRGLQTLDESGDSDVKHQAMLFMASVGFPLGGGN